MKKTLASILAGASMLALTASAQNTGPVEYNSFTLDYPFYYLNTSTLVSPAADFSSATIFFQIFAGSSADNLTAITPSGAGSSIQAITADGPYFDYGFAYTGLANNSSGFFKIQAWESATAGTPGTYESAFGVRPTAEVTWTQTVGAQATGSPPPPPSNVALFNGASPLVLTVVPEPTTIAFGVLGGLALLARRRRE